MSNLLPQQPEPKRRVFTDIAPKKREIAAQMFRAPEPRIVRPERPPMREKNRRFSRKFFLWFFGVLVLIIGVSFWNIGRARMHITVTPQTVEMPIDSILNVVRGSSDIPLRLISEPQKYGGTFHGQVTESTVEEKAKGSIVIFNSYSSSPQQLVINTSFQTEDGKIYRITNAVTIPGYRKDGTKIIPGSREVSVVADKSGPEFNSGLVDFTIPGFKGSPQFQKIIARSKTELIGGFKGKRPVVGADDLEKALLKLKVEAEEKAYGSLQAKLEPGSLIVRSTAQFVILDSGISIPENTGAGTFKLEISGESRAAFVHEEDVKKALPKDAIKIPQPIQITNIGSLSYEFDGYAYDATRAALHITGTVRLESLVDIGSIKKEAVSKKLASSQDILRNFPQLFEVSVRFRPFWFHYVPMDEARIDIDTKAR